MPTEILMPKLGLTMKEGTVVNWFRDEGESVEEKETVLDIETEKLSYSVEAPASGVVLKKLADVGEKYPVSAILGYIGKPGEKIPETGKKTPGGADSVDVPGAERKNMGVAQFPYRLSDTEGASKSEGVSRAEGASNMGRSVFDDSDTGRRVFISPLAKKMAAELGLDYRRINGTGPNGRIVKADVLAYKKSTPTAELPGVGRNHPPATQFGTAARGATIPYAGLRRAVGETMKYAWETIPMVTHQVSLDAGALEEYRLLLNAGVKDREMRVTIGELLIKLTAAALMLMPIMNSSLTEDGIVLHRNINIGMATALDEGLIVPVVQDADRKGLLTVSGEAKELAARARAGKLTPDDVHGATFTVSNLGGFGSVDFFTPIINPPQAAILGVGRIVDAPAAVGGEIKIRPKLGLSLTYDHRIIDGATAADFIKILMKLMENPARSVLN